MNGPAQRHQYPPARRRGLEHESRDDEDKGENNEDTATAANDQLSKIDEQAEEALRRYKAAIVSAGVAEDGDALICLALGCGQSFPSPRALHQHVARSHLHRCLACNAAFLRQDWADQHAQEKHSVLFAAMVEKQRNQRDQYQQGKEDEEGGVKQANTAAAKPQQKSVNAASPYSYRCWIEGCPDDSRAALLSDAEREHHLICRHFVPKTHFSRVKGGALRSLEATLELAIQAIFSPQPAPPASMNSAQHQPVAAVCRYFNAPSGCREGDKCRFRHEKAIDADADAAAVAPVPSAAMVTDDDSNSDHPSTQKDATKKKRMPCYFYFLTPGGQSCKNGESCPFSHEKASTSSKHSDGHEMAEDQSREGGSDDNAALLSRLMTSSLSISRRLPSSSSSASSPPAFSFGHRRGGAALRGAGRGLTASSADDSEDNAASVPVVAPLAAPHPSAAAIPASAAATAKPASASSSLAFRPRTVAAAAKKKQLDNVAGASLTAAMSVTTTTTTMSVDDA